MNYKLELFKKYYNANTKNVAENAHYHFQEQLLGIPLNKKTVLELGCGKGFFALWLALVGNAAKVIAIDEYEGFGEDKNNYGFFEKTIEENGVNIELVKMDFLKNKFESGSFDIVVANYALHHIVRTGKYISNDPGTRKQWIDVFFEIRRILKKDGVLILKEVTRFNLWRFLPLRFRYMDWEIHPTKKEFAHVIRKAGFKNVDSRNVVNYKLRCISSLLNKNPLFSFFINPNFYFFANA